jgi:hypothetical protein
MFRPVDILLNRADPAIRRSFAFLQSSLGKATVAAFSGVACICWPALAGYPAGAACLYYAIHQFRPVAAWIYRDIRRDLSVDPAEDDAQPDAEGDS